MKIQDFLTQLLEHCGVDISNIAIEISEDDDFTRVSVQLDQEESGLLIGYHGETLESIQRLLRLIFQRSPEDKRIILNINEYRENREAKLKETVTTIAQEVLDSGQEYVFNTPLASHERFIIHSFISSDERFSDLESISLGVGRDRRLHIRPKQS